MRVVSMIFVRANFLEIMPIIANKINEKSEKKSVLCVFSWFFNTSYVLGATETKDKPITSHIILTIDSIAMC